MVGRNFFTKQRQPAELKKIMTGSNKSPVNSNDKSSGYLINLIENEDGGGLGILFMGLSIVLVILIIFINIADYSIYTYKRNQISKAMDYAITAASQEVNTNNSIEGISYGFSYDSGKRLMDNIEINIEKAQSTFLSVFYSNAKVSDLNINNKLLMCTTSVNQELIKFTIKAENKPPIQGTLGNSVELEEQINDALLNYWPGSESQLIYVNGNSKTNIIDKGTYVFAIIKDIELKGVFSDRKISLTCFAGAKLNRLTEDAF